MTEHHPNCEDATGAYPGSCTCKTIAMDNLIAQDADLIDNPLVDRLRWVSEWYFVDPVDGTAYASDDPLDAADRIEELEARYEKSQDQIDRLIAENERLRGLVQGWHYLAVGPDEMGDYYTHKQLIKASEPYAHPALRAISGEKQ